MCMSSFLLAFEYLIVLLCQEDIYKYFPLESYMQASS